ncbi:MAG: hypothetical protein DRN14_06680 [Thermoplasmata archaeon]|nr:MAG: hypothetical protein DRN14_06680 [Thermoplasmata archaeon]
MSLSMLGIGMAADADSDSTTLRAPDEILSIGWHPSGEYAIGVGYHGRIVKIYPNGTEESIESGVDTNLYMISWQPMGEYALILGEGGILLKLNGTQVVYLASHLGGIRSITWEDQDSKAKIESDGGTFLYPPDVNSAPTVEVTYPEDGGSLSGTVKVTGRAYDAEGTISKVEVSVDSGPWMAADGLYSWEYLLNTSQYSNGPHDLRIRAWDGRLYSPELALEVEIFNNHPPAVSMASPTSNEVMRGSTWVMGNAEDPDGSLVSVWVRVDSGDWQEAEGLSNWALTLDTELYSNGYHTITAVSYDGDLFSDPVSVEVIFYNKDVPYIEITSPAEGAEVSQGEEVRLSCLLDRDAAVYWNSDIDGYLGTGTELVAVLSPGTHTISARASWNGLTAEDCVTLTVTGNRDSPPALSILYPARDSVLRGNVVIKGTAMDDVDVTSLDLQIDGMSVRVNYEKGSWWYSWDTTDVKDGRHTVEVVASDGTHTVSRKITVYTDNSVLSAVPVPGAPENQEEHSGPYIGAVVSLVAVIGLTGFVSGNQALRYESLKLVLLPLYSRLRKEKVLDNFTRGSIYGFIVANPGAHYNLIKEELKLNNGAVLYHLNILEKENYIYSKREGMYKRFYPRLHTKSMLGDLQKKIIAFLEGRQCTLTEIAEQFSLSRRAAGYQMKVLQSMGIVRRMRKGKWTLAQA